jgi:heme/copper-type cytochrome/quinol oxidase subunit 2
MNLLRQCRAVPVIGIAVVALLLTLVAHPGSAQAADQKFTLINVIFDDTKIWLPSSLIVHEGDTIELTLINTLDVPHGFRIDTFGIEAIINAKSKSTVQFTAKGVGLHPYVCHLHPPHIGGQILVLEK